MVTLWPDIESGREMVKSDLDGLPRPSRFDYTWTVSSCRFDYASVLGHIDSIIDGPLSNLAMKHQI